MSLRLKDIGSVDPALAARIKAAEKRQRGSFGKIGKRDIERMASVLPQNTRAISLTDVKDMETAGYSSLVRSSNTMEPQVALWRDLVKEFGRWESGGECVWELQNVVPGRRFRVDIALPRFGLAVEMDGFKFHRSKGAYQNDRIRNRALVAHGWSVAGCFTGEVYSNVEAIVEDVRRAMANRTPLNPVVNKLNDFAWRFESWHGG